MCHIWAKSKRNWRPYLQARSSQFPKWFMTPSLKKRVWMMKVIINFTSFSNTTWPSIVFTFHLNSPMPRWRLGRSRPRLQPWSVFRRGDWRSDCSGWRYSMIINVSLCIRPTNLPSILRWCHCEVRLPDLVLTDCNVTGSTSNYGTASKPKFPLMELWTSVLLPELDDLVKVRILSRVIIICTDLLLGLECSEA